MVWIVLPAVFLVLTPLAVWVMRHDYRRHGRLTWLGFGVLVCWFFLPHLAMDFAVRYTSPWMLRQYVGLGLAILGLSILLNSILSFRSAKKVMALDPGKLTVSGLYRWSRNPQYVGWFLFVAGFGVMWWTWRCWIALAMLFAALHVIVFVEEEHLDRTFGDAYRDFRARVPRWFGAPRTGTTDS